MRPGRLVASRRSSTLPPALATSQSTAQVVGWINTRQSRRTAGTNLEGHLLRPIGRSLPTGLVYAWAPQQRVRESNPSFLAENQAASPIAELAMELAGDGLPARGLPLPTCPPPGSNGQPPVLHTDALPSELGGHEANGDHVGDPCPSRHLTPMGDGSPSACGVDGTRTRGLRPARATRYQLRYNPNSNSLAVGGPNHDMSAAAIRREVWHRGCESSLILSG